MTEPDTERILRAALEARAHGAVGDDRPVAPFGARAGTPARGHRAHRAPAVRSPARWIAPAAAAVLVAAVAVATSLVLPRGATNGSGSLAQAGRPGPSAISSPSVTRGATSSAAVATTPVHIKLKFSDGAQFGVGIPIIAYFSKQITDARALQSATTATVNGQPISGAWYFETSDALPGYPIEGHFRPQNYWPAHSNIMINMPVRGLSAGTGLAYNDSLSLAFSTGPANIATVNDATHQLTLVSDGTLVGTYPVSLGAPDTPTARGTKVIMEKGVSICMKGPGYDECGIKYTQRLTYGGEYLHAAPWNVAHIKSGVDSSNGCTNLLPADAQTLYGLLEIGDVVTYPNANGPAMTLGAGYGDWNVPWSQWLTGGLVPTH